MYDSSEKQRYLIEALSSSQFYGQIDAMEAGVDCVTLTVLPQGLLDVLLGLRDEEAFLCRQLVDITADDRLDAAKRFRVLYHLLSPRHNIRIRIAVPVDDGDVVPSACGMYGAAGWFEREVWDMFGIPFSGNPDLRRILSDYGFQGHPLRKDFPLTGYVELRYDVEKKKIVYEDVVLDQEFRDFDFISPWQGTAYPEDEQVVDANTVNK